MPDARRSEDAAIVADHSPEQSDLRHLHRFAEADDSSAFLTIIDRHERRVLTICHRVLGDGTDAQDACQETFIKLARKAGEVRENLGGWLRRCAVNTALNLMKSRSRRTRRERDAGADLEPDGEEDPEAIVADDEAVHLILGALGTLPPQERDLVTGHFFHERSLATLAAETGVSKAAVKKRLDRALEHLRLELKRNGISIDEVL